MVRESSSRAIKESEERVRRVERVAQLGLWEWVREDGQMFWSAGMYRVVGQTPGKFVPDWERILGIIHPDDRGAMAVALKQVLASSSSYSQAFRVIWEDGSVHWMQCEGEAVLDATGQIIGLCGTAQDVTAHYSAIEQVTASERMFRRLANSLPTLTVYVDAELRYRFVNHVWECWHNRQSQAVLGKTVRECLDPALYRRIEPYLEAALAGRAQSFELEASLPAMGRRYMHLNYYPDVDASGSVAGLFLLVTDLSEQRRTEEALLRQANALTEVDKRKDEFLAMLGHELRNPLTPIHNAVQILTRETARKDSERVDWAARIIADQTSKLITLTDDLLDVARITRGQIRLRWQRVDLREVIATSADASRSSVEARGQALTVSNPQSTVTVEGDPVRLGQIVTNLIRNSVKYTPRGGAISVSVESEAGQAVICVSDTGAGIAREFLPKIFDRFTSRSHSSDEEHDGLGLGLHLCRYLTERQHGTIEAHSEGLGRGAEFRVRLPLVVGPDPQPKQMAPKTTSSPLRCRVLVVDDHQAVAESMMILLKTMGQEVRTVSEGTAALKAVEEFRPDIVFLDLGLPGMDGYEVARRLRAEYAEEPLMVVALTGFGQSSDQQEAKAAGFDRYLIKPASVSQLTEVLWSLAKNM